MTNDTRILIAQIVGLVTVVLARFGIELDAQTQVDLIAGLSTFGLLLTAVMAKRKRPAETIDKQSGFISPSFAGALIVVSMFAALFLTLPGCTAPPQPLNTIAATSRALNDIALQVDLAQKSGQISNEREDALLDEVQRINDQLRVAAHVTGEAQARDLQAINDQLTALRIELAKERKP